MINNIKNSEEKLLDLLKQGGCRLGFLWKN